jgi:DNA modification methylase
MTISLSTLLPGKARHHTRDVPDKAEDKKRADLILEVTYRDPKTLRPNARNARKHPNRQIKKLAASMRQFGFLAPVALDGDGTLLAGHGRVEAAILAEITSIPTISLGHLSPEEARAYLISDNRLASESEWDFEILRVELEALSTMDLDFNLEMTGWETAEIDDLLDGEIKDVDNDPANDLPEVPNQEAAVTQLGDLWYLGDHRLFCGSSLLATSFKFLGDEKAQMVMSDPPYSVKMDAVVNKGRVKHPDFVQGGGEQSPEEFTAFLQTAFRNFADYSVLGSIHYIFMDHRHTEQVLTAGNAVYGPHKTLVVWHKVNGAGMSSFYRSQHELVWVFKNGSDKHRHLNSFGLGEHGRYRTNVWSYKGMAGFSRERDALLRAHPSVKPWSLIADSMRDCSLRGGIVLDGFAGSGTIFIGAEKTKRRGYGIELDPRYCDVCIHRWEKLTGKQATLSTSGQTFKEVAASRSRVTSPAPENAPIQSGDTHV